MALALYRKYRPRTFAEVIGQEHVTEPLSQALRTGRLHHAYLFSGPRGCGKTSSARILARSLNCDKGPTPDPCGECESCRALAPNGSGSIDVIEIDAASHGGVDDARDLRERAFFAPAASRYKIYVIDEAHMVSSAGFNALLKLVEEPPEYVKFVFATTEPEKVLGTIKSRTHHYPFRLIPPGVLRPYLEELCIREGVDVEPAVFPLVVRAGAGSARDSLSVLDQLIAGAGDEGVTYAGAAALLGVTDAALIDEMCDAISAGDGSAAFAAIDQVAEAGHDPRRFAADLLDRLRDLIVLQQVPDAVAKGLLDGPADQLQRMALQAERFGVATLSRCADIVHNGLVEMRGTTAPRLLLELVTARMLLPAADDTAGGLLHRLERMERRLGTAAGGEPTAPAAADSAVPASTAGVRPERPTPPVGTPVPDPPEAAPHPANDPAPSGGESVSGGVSPASGFAASGLPGVLDAAAVRRVWDEVLTMVGRKSKRAAAVVREATVRAVEGDTLVLVFKHSVHVEMLTHSPELLLEAVYEVLGGRWQLRCELGGEQGGRSPVTAPAPRSATSPEPAAAAPAPVDEEWPTLTQPGGAADAGPATDGAAPAPARGSGRGSTATKSGRATSGGGAKKPKRGSGGRGASADAGGKSGGDWRDGPPPDEPPYDPEYDGPVKPAGPAYEGFDPGDEPLDDAVDDRTARQTSEQQALALLQEAFGAEKIGEVDHR